uniref:Uncharacterized protein n=1 Tax=Kuenenia stuttgartiensis TaxID=174633 RepID=Q1Q4V9_KUEST|nr:unknown protein [Candidatus Kuenenia stuttgartiensis]
MTLHKTCDSFTMCKTIVSFINFPKEMFYVNKKTSINVKHFRCNRCVFPHGIKGIHICTSDADSLINLRYLILKIVQMK